jgi:hypothetical protein
VRERTVKAQWQESFDKPTSLSNLQVITQYAYVGRNLLILMYVCTSGRAENLRVVRIRGVQMLRFGGPAGLQGDDEQVQKFSRSQVIFTEDTLAEAGQRQGKKPLHSPKPMPMNRFCFDIDQGKHVNEWRLIR